jgi:hypothetical protein
MTSMAKPKSTKKSPSAPTPNPVGGIPVIDPTFAMQTAAALIGKKAAATSGAAHKESSTFKQLKEGLNQPPLKSIGNLLDKTGAGSSKKSGTPFTHASRQVGHNQTFGADASKSGVPRRTGG